MPSDTPAEFTKFKDFLQVLTSPDHKLHEKAWHEFESRYRTLILGRIHKITNRYEAVEEISANVMFKLVTNDFKVLRDFRAKESEAAFKVYLNQVARTTALAHVTPRPPTVSLNEDLPIEDKVSDGKLESSYRDSVTLLRAALSGSQKKKFNQERDIFIYLLRRHGDFKSKEVALMPMLTTSGHNVDIVVNRLEELVKKKKKTLRDFL